jgi:hypothetical protein
VLKNDVVRKGDYTPIPKYVRRQVTRSHCQICLQPYGRVYKLGKGIRCPRQHIEHMISRRYLHQHGINCHHPQILLSVCQHCGIPKALEDRLYQGDVLSFLQGLSRLGYPVARVVRFAASVGLKEFEGVNV